MTKTSNQIMKELEQPDNCLCLNEHSCCIVYGYKPIVDYIFTPIINKLFKPIGRGIKKLIISCAMICGNCSVGCIAIPGTKE